MTGQPQRVTLNDIIQADPRVKELKKRYENFQTEKNKLIIDISNVEANIISKMGVFEYLNSFKDADDEQKNLLPIFRTLITKKRVIIETIRDKEHAMEDTTKEFDVIAESIVKELQNKFKNPQSAESCESCPESCPENCDGSCTDECTCTDKETNHPEIPGPEASR